MTLSATFRPEAYLGATGHVYSRSTQADETVVTLSLAVPDQIQTGVAANITVAISRTLNTDVSVDLAMSGVSGSLSSSSTVIAAGDIDSTITATLTSAGTVTFTATATELSASASATAQVTAVEFIELPNHAWTMDPSNPFGSANKLTTAATNNFDTGGRYMPMASVFSAYRDRGDGTSYSTGTKFNFTTKAAPTAVGSAPSAGLTTTAILLNFGDPTFEAIQRVTQDGRETYRFEIDKTKSKWGYEPPNAAQTPGVTQVARCRAELNAKREYTVGEGPSSAMTPFGVEEWRAFALWIPADTKNLKIQTMILSTGHECGKLLNGGSPQVRLVNSVQGQAGALKLIHTVDRYVGTWPTSSTTPKIRQVHSGVLRDNVPTNEWLWIVQRNVLLPGYKDPTWGRIYGDSVEADGDPERPTDGRPVGISDMWFVRGNNAPTTNPTSSYRGWWGAPLSVGSSLLVSKYMTTVDSQTRCHMSHYPQIGPYGTFEWTAASASPNKLVIYAHASAWRTVDQPDQSFGVRDVLYALRGS